jgi:hypothetical protein
MTTYLRSTRHPWSSFLFLVPLLAAYEGGILWLGGDQAGRLRSQSDAWMRWALEVLGVGQVYAAPAVVLGFLLLWSWWRWGDRPEDPARAWFGMAFESGLFALLLWQLGQNFPQLIDRLGVRLEITPQTARAAQVLTFIGAGIYEEVLFRLGLFAGACFLLRLVFLPGSVALVLSAAGAAVTFAAAHHIGPYGEPMNSQVFVFRALAGLFFTILFVARGFGVAVGAHAGYDILVGVSVS